MYTEQSDYIRILRAQNAAVSESVLIKAKARIADRAHWTTGQAARNAVGEPTMSTNADAVCWCAYGAINAETEGLLAVGERTEQFLIDACIEVFQTDMLALNVNDNPERGFDAVHEIYDRAIANAHAAACGFTAKS